MSETKNKLAELKIIFVVDDEVDILELIALHLEKAGYQVKRFTEATSMMAEVEKHVPDLLVLDLMLPDIDGLEVCKSLRGNERYAAIPIIMVTARTAELDVVLGLELGADDYIPKPFSPRELVARVKAVLRRNTPHLNTSRKIITIGNILSIDLLKHEVLVAGTPVELTATEFLILKVLAEKPGWVFSREKILDRAWGGDTDVFDRTVDVHIRHLREKLGTAGSLIRNIRGVGYKLEGSL